MNHRKWLRNSIVILWFASLMGCQKYEIKYVGQMQITEQKIKLPDVGPPFSYDKVVRDNSSFHFTLENMDFEDLDNIQHLNLEIFICGQSDFETNLRSAMYFPEEIKFADGPPDSQTDKSFYSVFVPSLLMEMKENAKAQEKPICARINHWVPWEFKKKSNLVKLTEY